MRKYILEYKYFFDQYTDLIVEGGAFGHLSHPFEDMELTFDDLKIMIKMLMEDGLTMSNMIVEKTDGCQLSFSWKNGQLVCARNKYHLKNFGENALNTIGLQDMFKGRGDIEEAFTLAVNDLEQAISKMSIKDKQNFFQNGRKFMSVEVMYAKLENSIPYNLDMLIFHGLIEYDINGNAISMDKQAGIEVAKILQNINANIGKTFKINGPNPIEILKTSDFTDKAKNYLTDLIKLQKEFNLKDTNTLAEYHYEWFKNYIKEKAKLFAFNISDELVSKLAKCFGNQDKSAIKATEFKTIDNKEFVNWLIEFSKQEYNIVYKHNMKNFEQIFFKVGVDILQTLSNYLVFNKDQSKQQMKKKFEFAIDIMNKNQDTTKIATMIDYLKRIDDLGGIDKIAPTEGICFYYNNKLYKITGLFALYHKVVSTLRFDR